MQLGNDSTNPSKKLDGLLENLKPFFLIFAFPLQFKASIAKSASSTLTNTALG